MNQKSNPLKDKEYIQINQALFSAVNVYESRIRKGKTRSSLTVSERGMIMVVGQFEPVNSRKLSRIMDINPGTISLYVNKLVKKGIVNREQGLEDRRNWWLTLTEAGKAEYSDTCSGAIEYTRDILAVLSRPEQESLHKLLLKVSRYNGYDW